jgi:hypothetical protein
MNYVKLTPTLIRAFTDRAEIWEGDEDIRSANPLIDRNIDSIYKSLSAVYSPTGRKSADIIFSDEEMDTLLVIAREEADKFWGMLEYGYLDDKERAHARYVLNSIEAFEGQYSS